MKLFTLVILLISFTAAGQLGTDAPWMKDIAVQKSSGEVTYEQVKSAGEQYWSSHNQNAKGSGYKPFLRWLERTKPYVKQDGTIQSGQDVADQLNGFMQAKNGYVDKSRFNPVGPFSYENTTSWSPGQGRINTVAVDPNNTNTYYVGAPSGGLWKSTTAGQSWTPLTDFLSQIGVSAIAIDSNNSNVVYIGTGDDDAGDSSSIGMLKSTNGGASFTETALTFNDPGANISEIYLDPSNSNTVYVSSNMGFYKSMNAGMTIKRTFNGNVKDIKINTEDSSIIYLATSKSFYKSEDAGETFREIKQGLPSGITRMVIGVSKADANVVYLLAVNTENSLMGVYRSTDAGTSFEKRDAGVDILENKQGWYNLALEVSQTDADVIYTGALNVWKSTNGGSDFTRVNTWNNPESPTYTHADIHQIREFDGELFVLSDGGIYRSSNEATSFTDLTSGLQIGQFYRIAVGSNSSSNITGGLQDNGGFTRSGNTWKNFHGADGMESGIDPNNSDVRYSFTQFGLGLYITNDAGSMQKKIDGPSMGNWITPLQTTSTGDIYAGYNKLYKVDGDNFTAVSSSFTGNIDILEIDPINENIMYVAVDEQLFRSTDAGKEFTWIKELPGEITAIEVNNNNNNIVYIATGSAYGKVMMSNDMGAEFIDITSNLPQLGKNTLAHLANSADNALFLGTTVGIFKYLDNNKTWVKFSNNLPNVNVRDIEINPVDMIMTAGTYGRGVWQTTVEFVQPMDDISMKSVTNTGGSIDCGSNSVEVLLENTGINPINEVTISYWINGGNKVTRDYSLEIDAQEQTYLTIDDLNLEPGSYALRLEVAAAKDEFLSNNFKTLTIVQNNSANLNQNYGFEQDETMVTLNDKSSNVLWERGVPQGLLLNAAASGKQVYGTNLNGNYTDLTQAYLYTGCYDLANVDTAEFKFDMAFDLEQDWDIFYIQYSTDNGSNWNLLGNANDSNWYNSDKSDQGNNCFSCQGGQWTGTNSQMTTYSTSLDNLAGQASVVFRFVFHSDQSINQEGVVLDNVQITGKTASSNTPKELLYTVYPNPSNGVFNIDWKMDTEYDYQVSDITGKQIMQSSLINNKKEILDLTGFASGLYFLTISSSGDTTTQKLLVR
ncbi:Por secretion system C-terminal sorting domain-containing protein [Nonlabens sp. Hel1_33_55]|uniref:T9SS type A sorting domain-containing protein n=1 Tax=Nonlabens sp. Hel1_33_55 TaxID=1336802 RepID=UPI000875BB9B|nr:T9SS type A sorting domain-containing protein [Nonlabens sp. Hel1_33_55]SCY37077.1 Por secretion system C-terminal sorting domain-containing protein [Nonlabens sp. Hel1_33_55]